ncbi:MAG: hypothetical protein MPN21_06095 [Thermoanaerobaculia bacterium]|nr:hypothetical protein [Thermoanaerobaculia bacterium]
MKLSPQTLILTLALALCSVWPTPELWTWLGAYFLAWLILNYTLGSGRKVKIEVRPWIAVALASLLAAPALAYLWRSADLVARREGLRGLEVQLEDRIRLETTPTVFPPVIAGDRPQNVYLHAPGGSEVALRLADGTAELAGIALGQDLFRVEYDPRRHGIPSADSSSLEAEVVVDGSTSRRALRYVRWQPHPRSPCTDPERGTAVVPSEETDEVFLVRRSGERIAMETLGVGDGPSGCAVLTQGRVAVSHRYDRFLQVMPTSQSEAEQSLELGPFQVAVAASADGAHLAVAQAGNRPGIVLLSTDPLAVVERIPLDEGLDLHFAGGLEPDGVHFGRAGADQIVVTSARHRAIFRLDRDTSAAGGWRQTELYLGRPAVTSTLSRDRSSLYVAVTDYRPDGVEHRGNHFLQDQILRIDVGTWQVVNRLLTGRRSERQDYPGGVDRGVSPMGMAPFGEDGLLVVFAGSEEAWLLDTDLVQPPTMFFRDFDLVAPFGVADLGGGVWLATSPAGGSMATYDSQGLLVEYLSVSPTDGELAAAPPGSLLRQDLDLRSGERAFFETTRSGISCQSCHLHGGTDFAPHDIGQAPLLHTLTTRGLAGTAPYLRDGSFPRIRDLHFDLAEPLYRGYRRRLENRPTLLESYVHALVSETNPALFEPRDLETERAGLQAFARARCDMCHTLPAFTNLSRHGSRTLFPEHDAQPTLFLDTPSLLAVHTKEDFLHDGRAHDLEAVLEEFNESNRHGDTERLDAAEKRALLHLLRSL